MQQLNQFVYTVQTGEVVTIIATPIKVAPEAVRASTEGQSLPNMNGATPEFQFGVNKQAPGVQIAEVLCNFPHLPGDPDEEGECRLRLTGSKGGDFTGPTMLESDPMHVFQFTFLVEGPAPSGKSLADAFAARGQGQPKTTDKAAKKKRTRK
jgi:hypothetical protein